MHRVAIPKFRRQADGRPPGRHIIALAELLLQRMLVKIEGLCDERDRLKRAVL
jgi:hypothetical protein